MYFYFKTDMLHLAQGRVAILVIMEDVFLRNKEILIILIVAILVIMEDVFLQKEKKSLKDLTLVAILVIMEDVFLHSLQKNSKYRK